MLEGILSTMFHAAQMMVLERESPLLNPGSILDQCHRILGHVVKYLTNVPEVEIGPMKNSLAQHPLVLDPLARQMVFHRIGFQNLDRLLGPGVMRPPPVLRSTTMEFNNQQVASGAVAREWAQAAGSPVAPLPGPAIQTFVQTGDRTIQRGVPQTMSGGRTNADLARELGVLEYMAENQRLEAAVKAVRSQTLPPVLPQKAEPSVRVQAVDVEPFHPENGGQFTSTAGEFFVL